ncbi:MAG TPA: hypothetical protein ENO22_02255 [candidate division Zixibacteria bacterium]|nr:hypothetical protein [candidate division Zixibacteria bacterium]
MKYRPKARTIDEYISAFPKDIQQIMEKLRATIRRAAPDAEEAIKYGIPTFVLHKNLVHFAAFQNHIGFYPEPSGILAFKKELAEYKTARGSVQFPLDQKLPYKLVERIVKFRVKENIAGLKKK